jgi:hypothetical protein
MAYFYPIHRNGRYVRLQLTGSDYLHSVEVTVRSSSRVIDPLAVSNSPFEFATAYRPPAESIR